MQSWKYRGYASCMDRDLETRSDVGEKGKYREREDAEIGVPGYHYRTYARVDTQCNYRDTPMGNVQAFMQDMFAVQDMRVDMKM